MKQEHLNTSEVGPLQILPTAVSYELHPRSGEQRVRTTLHVRFLNGADGN